MNTCAQHNESDNDRILFKDINKYYITLPKMLFEGVPNTAIEQLRVAA